MKSGIFFKNFLITVLTFSVCLISFAMVVLVASRMGLLRERQNSLYSSASQIRLLSITLELGDDLTKPAFHTALTAVSASSGYHVLLCDRDGVVAVSSDPEVPSPYAGMRLSADILARLDETHSYAELGTLDGLYAEQRYIVAVPLASLYDEPTGYIFVTCSSDRITSTWDGFTILYIIFAVGILVFAVCLQYVNSRRLVRPLNMMAEAADSYSRGDYSPRIELPVRGNSEELRSLTTAFNAMADALESNEARRREFISNISHELRTPMTTVSGFADGILDGTIPPSKQRRYLETISSETKRLSRLVRSMLDMSRLREGDPIQRQERFDLTEMVLRTAISFEERVTKKRLHMALNLPENPLYAQGDVDALTRVMYNLVDNAIKFAEEDTELSVSVWKEHSKAYVCVQDVGATIPSDELPLIFDRFHKADHSRSANPEGAGLGLYMVREIIAVHKQDIFVASEDGVTSFTFTLALAEGGM